MKKRNSLHVGRVDNRVLLCYNLSNTKDKKGGAPYQSRFIFDYWEACSRSEETELLKGGFIATYCKDFKKLKTIACGFPIALGGLLMFLCDVAVLLFLCWGYACFYFYRIFSPTSAALTKN